MSQKQAPTGSSLRDRMAPPFGRASEKLVAPPAAPVAAPETPKKSSLLSGLIKRVPFSLRAKAPSFTRRHMRHDCCIVARLHLTEKKIPLDGLVLEVSCGGVLFRTASVFILNRTGEEVSVEFADLMVDGAIVASRDIGYGVKFTTEIDEDTVEQVAARYGYKVGEQPFGSERVVEVIPG